MASTDALTMPSASTSSLPLTPGNISLDLSATPHRQSSLVLPPDVPGVRQSVLRGESLAMSPMAVSNKRGNQPSHGGAFEPPHRRRDLGQRSGDPLRGDTVPSSPERMRAITRMSREASALPAGESLRVTDGTSTGDGMRVVAPVAPAQVTRTVIARGPGEKAVVHVASPTKVPYKHDSLDW